MTQAQFAHNTMVSGFVDSLQEPRTPYISPKLLSQALGVKVANLAQLTGVHRNTLRNPASARLQGRMREMVKVISAATERTGAVDKAIYWYRDEPIADYGIARRPSLSPRVRSKQFWSSSGTLRTGLAGESRPRQNGRDLP
nr:hypothetical protein [Mesorhizobium sp. B2-3-5]